MGTKLVRWRDSRTAYARKLLGGSWIFHDAFVRPAGLQYEQTGDTYSFGGFRPFLGVL